MVAAILDSRPLLFLIAFIPSFLLISRFSRQKAPYVRWAVYLCEGLCIFGYVLLSFLKVFRPGIVWGDEGHILAVAAAYIGGQPLYHALHAPDLYSLLYGPATFLIFAPVLAGFSNPIPALNLAMLVANSANLVLMFLILRERVSRRIALAILPLAAAFLLSFPEHLFGIRGDSWLLLCICLALYGALRRNWIVAAMAIGIFAGLSIDFKPTVLPVVFLTFAILYRRHGLRATFTSFIACAASSLAVFLLPGISLSNYIVWLGLAGHQQLLRSNAVDGIQTAAFLVLPCLLMVIFGNRAQTKADYGFVVPILGLLALCSCVVAGSKDGAGAWHLWPMLPFVMYWTAYETSLRGVGTQCRESEIHNEATAIPVHDSTRALCFVSAIALAATLVALRYGVRDLQTVHPEGEAQLRAADHRAEDVIKTLVHQPTSGRNLAMGYGTLATDYRTNLRFELSLNGQEYFVDENAVVEAIRENLPIPSGVVQRILGCNDRWLIPHGEVPFSTLRTGVLPMDVTPFLFPDSVRLHFTESHVLLESGEIYDVWGCPTTISQ